MQPAWLPFHQQLRCFQRSGARGGIGCGFRGVAMALPISIGRTLPARDEVPRLYLVKFAGLPVFVRVLRVCFLILVRRYRRNFGVNHGLICSMLKFFMRVPSKPYWSCLVRDRASGEKVSLTLTLFWVKTRTATFRRAREHPARVCEHPRCWGNRSSSVARLFFQKGTIDGDQVYFPNQASTWARYEFKGRSRAFRQVTGRRGIFSDHGETDATCVR